MKKVFLFLLAATLLVACEPQGQGTGNGDIESMSVTPATLQLKIGSSKLLNVSTVPATASQEGIVWSSSDETVAPVSAIGKVDALAEGTATITAKIGEVTATAEVSVVSALSALTFDQAVVFEIADSFIVAPDYAWKKYDEETGDSIEINKAYNITLYMLANDVFINGDGYIAGADNYFMKMKTSIMVGDNTWYSLGAYSTRESILDENDNQIPYSVQVASFDADVYTAYFTALLNGESVSETEYPFYGENDSYFYMLLNDAEAGEAYWSNGGYLSAGDGVIELAAHKTETSVTYYSVPYYAIEGTFFGNPYSYGLDYYVSEEDGETYFTDPLTMAPMETATLTAGTSVYSAPAAGAPKYNGVDRAAFELEVATNRLTKMALYTKLQDATYARK